MPISSISAWTVFIAGKTVNECSCREEAKLQFWFPFSENKSLRVAVLPIAVILLLKHQIFFCQNKLYETWRDSVITHPPSMERQEFMLFLMHEDHHLNSGGLSLICPANSEHHHCPIPVWGLLSEHLALFGFPNFQSSPLLFLLLSITESLLPCLNTQIK